jgi:hypothetical protein
MFKAFAFAAATAAALVTVPANAATFLLVTNTSPLVCTGADPTCNFVLTGEVDTAGAFTVTSNIFTLPTTGSFGGIATNTATDTTNIDFSTVILTNLTTSATYTGTVDDFGVFSVAFFGPDDVTSGGFTLTLTGMATIDTGVPPSFPSIGGTASFTAGVIPEPATWALFILGFGAVGHTMRRRSSKVRIAKAELNFA